MGVRVEIGGQPVEIFNYSIRESSTPLAGGDDSGAVGSADIELPVFDGFAPGGVFATNLVTNPEGAGTGSIEVWRNYALNPLGANTVGYLANSPAMHTVTRAAAAPPGNPQGITTAVRSVNGGTASPAAMSLYDIDGLANVNPAMYVGAWFYVDSSGYEATLDNVGAGPWTAIAANTWVWVTSALRGANTYRVAAVRRVGGTGTAGPGVNSYITGVTEQPGIAPDKSIAPALSNPDPDMTASWTGTANNSPCILSGVPVTGAMNGISRAIRSSQWFLDGPYSARIISLGNAAGSPYAEVAQFAGGPLLGKTITIVVTSRSNGVVMGTSPRRPALRMYGYATPFLYGPVSTNVAGVEEIRWTVTIPNDISISTIGLRLFTTETSSLGVPQPDVWWDVHTVVEGTYAGPPFSGASPTDYARNVTYNWTGTPDASTSVARSLVSVPANPLMLGREPLNFIDTARGSWLGAIEGVSEDRAARSVSLEVSSRLALFMVEVQSAPHIGTVESCFNYLCSLAGINSDIFVDDSIKSNPSNIPGFNGNLWLYMKDFAKAISCDLNLISNNVILRPVRAFEAATGKETDSNIALDAGSLALKQEVRWYETKEIASGPIYPPQGWNPEVKVYSVTAGQVAEYDLQLEASVSSVVQPTCVASVAPGFTAGSVYTVIGDDDIHLPPAMWTDYGGSLTVAINPDTRSLKITLRGASGILQPSGAPMQTFRIALTAGTSDSTYSTLRLIGSGVSLIQNSLILPTGVAPSQTTQEFAPTIDNIFLNSLNEAYSAGTRGASRYSGKSIALDQSVVAVNKRGESGTANYPSYNFVQGIWGAGTYATRQTANAGKTYDEVRAELFELVQDNFENQLFGNVSGARVWDRGSSRWFRVRNANTDWSSTKIDADDDTLFSDVQNSLNGMTYAQVQTARNGLTYYKAHMKGVAA